MTDMMLLGYAIEAVSAGVLIWAVIMLYVDYRDSIVQRYLKDRAFESWRKRHGRLGGME